VTVTFFVAVDEPYTFRAVSVTAQVPGVRKIMVGCCFAVRSLPPKDHRHDVGFPADVSVNLK
jgi:hypothetical protein